MRVMGVVVVVEFEERSARRQEGARRTEFNEKLKKMNERIAGVYEGDG